MIKKMVKSVREYKTSSILTSVFVCLEVIIEVFLPLLMAELIDQIYAEELSQIFKLGIILVAGAFVSLLFGFLSGKFCAKASSGFAKNLRKDMYYKIQNFSFSNIDKFSSASLVTRLTTDVSNVQHAYMMIIRIAVRSPLMFIFSLIMSFTINVKMGLIFLCVIPILAVGLVLIMLKAKGLFDKVFKKYDALNNSIQENVRGMRVVKAYVREEHEKEKFGDACEDVHNDFVKAEKIIALNAPLMNFCMHLTTLLVAGFGAMLIVNTFGGIDAEGLYIWGELSTGNLASLVTYSIQILSSLMMLSMVMVMITLSLASGKRIVEVLDEVPDIQNPKNPVLKVKDGSIDFKNVSFKYSKTADKMALKGVNLSIKSGETIGILGGTGSSKTTLVNLISRLYDVTTGEVRVGKVDVRDYDIETLRNEVAVVLQKNVLFSGTIKENLRWGDANATDEDMIRVCKLAEAHDFISSFLDGYDTKIDQGGANVSGGQKQRLCIARALLKKPKILILDDSTSAVDTKTDAKIRKAFKEEIPNTTKIIIAQRISSIQDADKIIVMDGGEVVSMGTHEELLKTSSIYREVYESQNKVGGNDER